MALPVMIFGGVGALLGLWAAINAMRVHRRLATWTRASGVVVGQRPRRTRRDGRSRTTYHPIIEFQENERIRVFESPLSTSTPRHAVGAPVPVRFNPQHPEDAVVDTFGEKHFVSFVLGGIGAAFIATAAWLSTQPP